MCKKEYVKSECKPNRKAISKFLSGLLRHFGNKYGLEIDEYGWASLDDVSEVVSKKFNVNVDVIKSIVDTDSKGRFEIANSKIRAKYGHTLNVNVDWSENGKIPEKLYHGTHPKNVSSILKNGLKPVKRKEVHLSPTIQDAIEVGKRYTKDPVVFEIDAKSMIDSGFKIRKKGNVYTADFVPSRFIKLLKV